MTRNRMRTAILLTVLSAAALPAQGGHGVAELSLDRGTITELLSAALPEPLSLSVPGVGAVTLRVDPPGRVEFRDGGIEATLPLRWIEAGWSEPLEVRYVPDVDPLSGVIRLRPESVRLARPLPFPVDLAPWLDELDLPRKLDWKLELGAETGIDASCFLQGIEVRDERVVVLLGLVLGED